MEGRAEAIEGLDRVRGDEAAPPVEAGSRPVRRAVVQSLHSVLPGPRVVLVLVLLMTALTRLVWLGRPDHALVFDEAYYVNAARRILGLTVPADDPYATDPAGIDPNSEHPPLGKVLIAGSMKLFGDGPLGWRAPSIAAGVVLVAAVYLLVVSAGHERWAGVYAALVTSLDNLVLVHTRIGTLDILYVAPLLLAAVLVVRGHQVSAGVACAAALCVKLPAAFGVGALALLVLVSPGSQRVVTRIRRTAVLVVSTTVVSLGLLWLLDLRFTSYDSPFAHLHHIVSYGVNLDRSGGPVNSESDPWQWLSNDVQIPYLRVDTNVLANGQVVSTQPSVWFRGGMNPALAGVAVTGLTYAIWRWRRRGDVLSSWSVVWSGGIFLAYVALWLVPHRVSYLFYVLPLVPAFAVAATLLLWHEGLPRACRWGFLLAMLLGFAAYFPFRDILRW